MTDRDALIRRIARHEFPDPRVVRQGSGPRPDASPATAGGGPQRPASAPEQEPPAGAAPA